MITSDHSTVNTPEQKEGHGQQVQGREYGDGVLKGTVEQRSLFCSGGLDSPGPNPDSRMFC